jgi:hypothetical protein
MGEAGGRRKRATEPWRFGGLAGPDGRRKRATEPWHQELDLLHLLLQAVAVAFDLRVAAAVEGSKAFEGGRPRQVVNAAAWAWAQDAGAERRGQETALDQGLMAHLPEAGVVGPVTFALRWGRSRLRGERFLKIRVKEMTDVYKFLSD